MSTAPTSKPPIHRHLPPPREKVRAILKGLQKLYPDARCALDHKNPFELLIATILSAQCTDARVNKVTPALFAAAPDPESMHALGEKKLSQFISSCGLYQSKAKNILATCFLLAKQHHGTVPKDRAALESLPGVGRKTANVVLSNAFGVPALAVDTHVFRVSQRLGLAQAKTPEHVERQLMEVIPRAEWIDAHHRMILHGRSLCAARRPNCTDCPLKKLCNFGIQSLATQARP